MSHGPTSDHAMPTCCPPANAPPCISSLSNQPKHNENLASSDQRKDKPLNFTMPPKLPGKNTATREYYTPNETTDTASDEDIEWPSGDEGMKSSTRSPKTTKPPKTPSSSAKSPPSSDVKSPASATGSSKGKEATSAEEGEGKQETPSPTPSDIVLSAGFLDVGKLAEENKRMMGEGVGERERRVRLERMRVELEKERENEGKKREGEEKG